jgi:hypothetical protein
VLPRRSVALVMHHVPVFMGMEQRGVLVHAHHPSFLADRSPPRRRRVEATVPDPTGPTRSPVRESQPDGATWWISASGWSRWFHSRC